MRTAVIEARYPGMCELCRGRIEPGDRIEWAPGRAMHERCVARRRAAGWMHRVERVWPPIG